MRKSIKTTRAISHFAYEESTREFAYSPPGPKSTFIYSVFLYSLDFPEAQVALKRARVK